VAAVQSSAAQSEAARLQAELAAQRAQHEAEMARKEADHTAALAQREAETETRVRSEDVAVGAEAKSLVQEYTEHAKQQEVCGPWLLLLLLMLPGWLCCRYLCLGSCACMHAQWGLGRPPNPWHWR
jgi:hypothetical protein